MTQPRLMLVHALAPPTPGGTPIVLQRLLTDLPGIEVEVVTNRNLRASVHAGGPRVLDARYRFVRKWPGWGGRFRFGRVASAVIDLVLAGVAGARIARWARRGEASWVMSVTDDGFSVIAGAIAARLAGLPHVVMVFDLWEENAYNDAQRAVARRLEGPIFRSAAKVVGYCREVVEHYRAKHGIAAAMIATPVELGEMHACRPRVDSGPTELLLAGAVYWAQLDAIARLLTLRGRLPGLKFVAVGNEPSMRANHLTADRFEPALVGAEFRHRLARADILFLGLSFDTDHPAIIRTATPARLVEYMASGTPLLVHAPRGSHVAEYARREGFAEVVDVADADALQAGLRTVLDDDARRRARAGTARRIAAQRHDARVVRASFVLLLRELRNESTREVDAEPVSQY